MKKAAFEYDPKGHSAQLYHSRHRVMNWVHGAHIRESLRRAPLSKDALVLDAGCSDGELFARAAGRYRLAAGLDHNFEALPTFKTRLADQPGAFPLRGDLKHLPFAGGTFDAVFCLETLEHVPDMPASVGELKRVLRDEGALIVTVPIERGLSILLKQGVANLFFGGYRGTYTWSEIWNAFRGRLDRVPRPSLSSHKGFDYTKVIEEIRGRFSEVSVAGLPFKPFGTMLNTQVLIEARGKR